MWRYNADPYEVRPHEHTLEAFRLNEYLKQLQAADGSLGYSPFPAIRLGGDNILLEGTHTSGSLFLINRRLVLNILETDEDVKNCNEGYVMLFKSLSDLKDDVKSRLRDAAANGVVRLPEIRVKFREGDLMTLNQQGVLERIASLRPSERPDVEVRQTTRIYQSMWIPGDA